MKVSDGGGGEFFYPSEHWAELKQFYLGKKADPKGCFLLAKDVWEVWKYSANRLPSEAYKYRFNFGGLRSFIKLYVKRYCYNLIIGSAGAISTNITNLPSYLYKADLHILGRGFCSLTEIGPLDIFNEVWDSHLVDQKNDDGEIIGRSVWRQKSTYPFWVDLSLRFGCPQSVPRIKYPKKRHPTEAAGDKDDLIPLPVIRQFVNKLALHRDGQARLNCFHHLRLCVLVLTFCLGRRISEVLTSHRGSGTNGPLVRHPSRSGTPEGELWFVFNPNKNGPEKYVYVSPEWEKLTMYCVQELIRYGDEVRHLALEEEQDLLILISPWNWTRGGGAKKGIVREEGVDWTLQRASGVRRLPCIIRSYKMFARGLSYPALRRWLYGAYDAVDPSKFHQGVLEEWKITADGSADGEIYRLRTHQARHNRATALAEDSEIPLLIRQRDLNQTSPDMPFAYNHALAEEHGTLLARTRNGELLGNGVQWLHRIIGLKEGSSSTQTDHQHGRPGIIDERFRRLIANSPQFVQFHRVKSGYCVKVQGPLSCEEYLHCTEAADGGCAFFVTDPGDEGQVNALQERACDHRARQQQSLEAGRTVQAGKYETLARRTEELHERACQMRERLREGLLEAGVKNS